MHGADSDTNNHRQFNSFTHFTTAATPPQTMRTQSQEVSACLLSGKFFRQFVFCCIQFPHRQSPPQMNRSSSIGAWPTAIPCWTSARCPSWCCCPFAAVAVSSATNGSSRPRTASCERKVNLKWCFRTSLGEIWDFIRLRRKYGYNKHSLSRYATEIIGWLGRNVLNC